MEQWFDVESHVGEDNFKFIRSVFFSIISMEGANI